MSKETDENNVQRRKLEYMHGRTRFRKNKEKTKS